MTMKNLLKQPRLPFALALAVSISLVGGGVLLAQLLRLAACPLCVIQRMLYLLLALAAGFGLLLATRPMARMLAALLMTASAASGAGVAAYQVWIQRFAPTTTCAAEMPWWEAFVEWAGRVVPMLFQPNGQCSDPAWKLFGLSIAEWSLLCFCGLCLLSLHTLLRRR
jgi:disulfide bond formation protein DsbB